MTGRERFLTTLSLREPDVVPTFVLAMNEVSVVNIGRHFVEGLPDAKSLDRMTFEEQLVMANALVRIHDELDIDALCEFPVDNNTNLDERHYRDQWNVVMEISSHGGAVPVGHPIQTPADLCAYRRPVFTEEALLAHEVLYPMVEGRKAVAFSTPGPFTLAWFLCGLQPCLIGMVRDPDFVHRLMRMTTDYVLEIVAHLDGSGVDAVVIADDIADKHNPFFSPKHYDTFLGPYLREIVDRAQAAALRPLFHSDGNLWPVLHRLIETGFEAVHPLEPVAGMDLAELKRAFGDRLCLVGNIDCGELLSHGTEAEVEAAVREAIEAAALGGGYVLSDSNSIHPGVKPENFIAMMRAAKRYGAYA